MLAGAAAQPVSERVLAAAGVENGQVSGHDFQTLLTLHRVTPELSSGSDGLRSVRLYYRLVDAIGTLAGIRMPAIAAWSERQAAACPPYAPVPVDRPPPTNL